MFRDWVTPSSLPLEELPVSLRAEDGFNLERPLVSISLPPLPQRRYQLTVFLEAQADPREGGAPRYSPCPSPPSLRDPLSLALIDPLFARWEGTLREERAQWLNLKRSTCGPGDLETELSGTLVASPEALKKAYILLSSLSEEPTSLPALIFPIEPLITSAQLATEEPLLSELTLDPLAYAYQFSVSQLRPGEVSVFVFTDDDEDRNYSPCSRLTFTGADQARSEELSILIERGSSSLLAEPVLLEDVQSCEGVSRERSSASEPDLVALTALIDVSDELLQSLQGQRASTWLWYQVGHEPPQRLADIDQLLRSQGRFTLLTSPAVLTEPLPFHLWVDQGGDGRFEPCSSTGEQGVDVRWWSGTTERLRPLAEGPLEAPLTLSTSCEAPEALISGEVALELEAFDQWGPRPLMIEREDLFTGERSYHRLALMSASELSAATYSFEQRVRPGSYALRAYIDQESFEGFQPCEPGALGELFASSSEELVSVSGGALRAGLTLRLAQLPCVTPSSTLILQPLSPNPERSTRGACGAQELILSVSSGGEELIPPRCAALSEGSLFIERLYGGPHTVTLCQEIEPSPVLGLPCEQARALTATTSLLMQRSPSQLEQVPLDYACECPTLSIQD